MYPSTKRRNQNIPSVIPLISDNDPSSICGSVYILIIFILCRFIIVFCQLRCFASIDFVIIKIDVDVSHLILPFLIRMRVTCL